MTILKNTGRIAAMAVLGIIAIAGVLRLIGHTRYLVTNGVSMSPLYHSGDLVIISPTSRYRIGDIAAYHSQLLHTTVLHRIVGISRGRYTFKGDHNSWFDPENPTADQLFGAARVRIPHGGAFLALHGALLAILSAAAIAFIIVTAPNGTSIAAGRSRPRLPGVVIYRRVTYGLVGGEALLAAALCTSFALNPSHPSSPNPTPTVETSAFTYSAQVAPNAVYPTGALATGDPIFTRIIPCLSIAYVYQANGPQSLQINGATQLVLAMSSSDGWHSYTSLGGPTPITAGHGQASATLDISALESTLAEVRSLTGVDTGTVNLTIHAKTNLTGSRGSSDFLDVPLNMEMTPLQLSLQGTTTNQGAAPPSVITTRLLEAPKSISRARPAARLAKAARLPLMIAMLLFAAGLVLHFFPTDSKARRTVEPQGEGTSG